MKKTFAPRLFKAVRIAFLIIVAFILLLFVSVVYFATKQADTVQGTFSDASYGTAFRSPEIKGGSFITTSNINGVPLGADEVSSAAPEVSGETALVDRKLTQNGYLSLVVGRVEDHITTLISITEDLGGSIDSINLNNSERDSDKSAQVILRVPAANFSEAMKRIKKSAVKTNSESVVMNDVTSSFIDMQARMKNLKAEEEQLQDILKKAGKVDEVMQVSNALFSVREEIDRLQGQMNYFSRQVDMSVITVGLSSEPDISTLVIWHPWTTIKDAVRGFLVGFYAFLKIIIYLVLVFVPIFILWIIVVGGIVWIFWLLAKKAKRKIFDGNTLNKK